MNDYAGLEPRIRIETLCRKKPAPSRSRASLIHRVGSNLDRRDKTNRAPEIRRQQPIAASRCSAADKWMCVNARARSKSDHSPRDSPLKESIRAASVPCDRITALRSLPESRDSRRLRALSSATMTRPRLQSDYFNGLLRGSRRSRAVP